MSGSEGSSIKQICTCAAGRSDASLQATFFRCCMDKNKIKKIILFAVLFIFMGLISIFIGIPLVNYASQPEKFRLLVENLGFWGYLLYLSMQIFQVVFALIPGEPFEILAGFSFGSFTGTILCLLGSVIGSSIVFLLTKKLGKRFVEIFFSIDKINSLKILNDKTKMYFLTFLLFFIPGTPKDLLTYVAGLTPIKFLPYIIISTVAKIPAILTSTLGGNAIGEKDYIFAIIIFAITGIISLTGIFIYNKITKK